MLRLPKPTREEIAASEKLRGHLAHLLDVIATTDDLDEQMQATKKVESLERDRNVCLSAYLIRAAKAQGIELKLGWIQTDSGAEWLTAEGQIGVAVALRRRRTEDWLKLIPMFISTVAILVSVASAVATSRISQQKDFLLNRSWLFASDVSFVAQSNSSGPTSSKPVMLIRVTNNGRALALHVATIAELMKTSAELDALKAVTSSACSTAFADSSLGDFIPPSSSLAVPAAPLSGSGSFDFSTNTGSNATVVVGCIGYEDSLDHKRHATSFAFETIPATTVAPPPSTNKGAPKTDSPIALTWAPRSFGFGIAY